MKLIDEAIVANMKSVIFNGKIASRIIRADSNTDDTIIVSETQEDNSHVAQNDETAVIEDSQTPTYDQQNSSLLTIIENIYSLLEATEIKFMKIEEHLIGFSNPISATNIDYGNTTPDNFYTN